MGYEYKHQTGIPHCSDGWDSKIIVIADLECGNDLFSGFQMDLSHKGVLGSVWYEHHFLLGSRTLVAHSTQRPHLLPNAVTPGIRIVTY